MMKIFLIIIVSIFVYCFIGGALCKLFNFAFDNFGIGEFEEDLIDITPILAIGTWPIGLLLFILELIFYIPCRLAGKIFSIDFY